jgi:hypothetical protein
MIRILGLRYTMEHLGLMEDRSHRMDPPKPIVYNLLKNWLWRDMIDFVHY